MYLQTWEKKNEKNFEAAMQIIRKSDVDLVVFPEFCFIPISINAINAGKIGLHKLSKP
jgi:predicted amidohydrolase